MKNTIITIVAITSIAIIEIFAIVNHINGALLGLSIGAIAGLGGYSVAWKRYHK